MASINIQFRLPDTYKGELEGYAVRGESYSQTARRLMLDLLDGVKDSAPPEPSAIPIPDDLGDRLSAIEDELRNDRLICLEKELMNLRGRTSVIEKQLDRQQNIEACLSDLVDQIAAIDANQDGASVGKSLGTLVCRVNTLEGKLHALEPPTATTDGDRLDKLEKHLDWAKREILDQRQKIKGLESDAYWYQGDKPAETAILMPKKSDSEATVTPEITFSHEQAGKEWQRNISTVRRWAKDPSKWPTGWIYDADKQFWVKTA